MSTNPSTAFFRESRHLGFRLDRTSDYWNPRSISFYSELGPIRLRFPKNRKDVKKFLKSYHVGTFFGNEKNLIIGCGAKDLISLLLHYGIHSKVRVIDPDLFLKLDPLGKNSEVKSDRARDLFYQIPWIRQRMSREKIGKLYRHLIEGSFNVLAGMENQGVCVENWKVVFPRYRIGVGESGRFSCTEDGGFFNPHSVPKDRQARERYLPQKGHRMILTDEQAMEMRILAHLSGDKNLTEVFAQGLDIHDIVARRLLNKSSSDVVSEEERRIAKAVGFLMVFGGTATGLSAKAGIPRWEAQRLIDSFFSTFPMVQKWILQTQIESLENGYIRSIFGRTRKLDPKKKRDRELRSMQNFCVQSPAADISTLCLRAIYHLLPKASKILFHIHDGMILSAPPEKVDETVEIVRLCMENPPGLNLFGVELKVPLKVNIKVTDHWE